MVGNTSAFCIATVKLVPVPGGDGSTYVTVPVSVAEKAAQEAADALVVCQRCVGALIVGRKDKTHSAEIAQLAGVMASSGIVLLGATLNEY